MELDLSIECLSSEYVLVQAFKKTVNYIRYHNWFSDTVELDRAAADLPNFLSQLSAKIRKSYWQPKPLRLVMAPKSQTWHWNENGVGWQPAPNQTINLRPIAHVSLEDQVLATAIMLCLANRVETAQGDPRKSYLNTSGREVRSYGNRLFCDLDTDGEVLQHRWASQTLYRAYFQDYQMFVERTDVLGTKEATQSDKAFVTQSDLSQFYDRVRPWHLSKALQSLKLEGDDPAFFELCDALFDWSWSKADRAAVQKYAENNGIGSMDQIALPQGLVASGFLANIILLDFDRQMASEIDRPLFPGVRLADYSRYVDDLRFIWRVDGETDVSELPSKITDWLVSPADDNFGFLRVSLEKTDSVEIGSDQTHLVKVSRKMQRIQRGLSGGFDAVGGKDLIQAIESLVKSQASISARISRNPKEPFKAVPDVKSETVNRFAAARFRSAYRSLRPLLPVGETQAATAEQTRFELDEDAQSFALELINACKDNPANVRLLRIGLDLWPSDKVLDQLLEIFRPFVDGTVKSRDAKRVAHYCLSEVFRAAATETGFTADQEALPEGIRLDSYRKRLYDFAVESIIFNSTPWYLKQQALLFVATHKPTQIERSASVSRSLASYFDLVNFLYNPKTSMEPSQFAVWAIVSRRSFPAQRDKLLESLQDIDPDAFTEIALRDIEFAQEIFLQLSQDIKLPSTLSDVFTNQLDDTVTDRQTLAKEVWRGQRVSNLRNEIGVLSFAVEFTKEYQTVRPEHSIGPSDVEVSIMPVGKYGRVESVTIDPQAKSRVFEELFSIPSWADATIAWRLSLGYLLRFILTARLDYSIPQTRPSWKSDKEIYRPTKGHYLLRHYGFYNGHEAFGDDWLPISQEVQSMLFALLRWPGCRSVGPDYDSLGLHRFQSLAQELLDARLAKIGEATQTLFLNVDAPNPSLDKPNRPLRGCVVQSVLPGVQDFSSADLEMDNPATRLRLRNHLTSALASVTKMLKLRETHKPDEGRLDWLIFPELAMHPEDVDRYLVPYARAKKTIILAGLIYERVVPSNPLVNSAIWILPVSTPGDGLQMIKLRQGKQHLSPMEAGFQPRIHGFRPCQWLVGYHWSTGADDDPLWLTGSICYDATDIGLASDLRSRSDIFAIPALNQDVGTFDNMAHALHYHMFQPVLIANNGTFGGSNKYSPKGSKSFVRQVFHTHGQPQATISFFEINDIGDLKQRWTKGYNKQDDWKYPPAGGII